MISYFCNNERPMHPEDLYIASKILGCRWDQLYEMIEEQAGTE